MSVGLGFSLGGWFKRNYAYVASALLSIPGCELLGAAVLAYGKYLSTPDNEGYDRQTVHTTYEPTEAEQGIINIWIKTKFTPWFITIGKEYATAFEKELIPTSQKLSVANSILRKIEAVDIYLQKNETTGLSAGAIAFRLEATGAFFDTITNKMREELLNTHLEMVKDQVISNITGFQLIITDATKFVGMIFSYPKFVIGAGVDFPGEPVVVVTPNSDPKGSPVVVVTPPKLDPKAEVIEPKPNDIIKELDNTTGKIVIGTVLLTLYLLISKKSKK